ncbi:beta-lactamase/transpeptidase-like protein [Mycena sp. CBHHK59/15]|nr:beta-lactamase/transpeptidase-like protein [Mycena sp. CBHHK59/15]
MRQVGRKVVDDPSSGLIDEDTVFWLCSQTKLITTLAALRLVEQGKIALNTHVEEVLPELANPVIITEYDSAGKPLTTTPAKSKITFGQLLNHSSGLDYGADPTKVTAGGLPTSYCHVYKDGDISAFFEINRGSLPGHPLKFEPGTSFGYGFGSDCAGFIVEHLSGKSLEEYFQEYIFAPLEIKSASFYPTPALKERMQQLAFRNTDGNLERWNDQVPIMTQDPTKVKVHLGGVGLFSSAKDYLAILRHLLQIKGLLTGKATNPILSPTSVDLLFEHSLPLAGATAIHAMAAFLSKNLSMPPGSAQFGRGLLVNTMDVPGKRRKDSGAWGGWANTSFFMDPTTGVAVVLGTQLAPACDDRYELLYSQVENELYRGFQVGL